MVINLLIAHDGENTMRLKNKVAIITGGGSGIGLACAKLFVREGAKVALFGRRQHRLEQAAMDIGNGTLAVVGDITKKEDSARLVKATLDTFKQIDILVNNAGIIAEAAVHESDDNLWDEVMNTNLNGAFRLTREVIKAMLSRKSGNIINISSILGMVARSGTAAYSASKGALDQLSRVIAVEYANNGIRSNSVNPGMIETEMIAEMKRDEELVAEVKKGYPMKRFGTPEEVAQACLFLASDEASYITGAVLAVDGGYTAQ
jgi:NAD(P)-dependent dehydrogenase (short-subunit alcohol dehydrogenase family)